MERLRPQGKTVTLEPGAAEMPIGELRRRVGSLAQSGPVRTARTWAWGYYLRWSLPWAPLALAVFALAVMPRRPVRGWILAAAACGACLAYYFVLLAGAFAARQTQLPVIALVWLPNLVFALASTALMAAAARPRLSSSSPKRSVSSV